MRSCTARIGLLVITLTSAPAFADLHITSWELNSGFVDPIFQFQTITDVSNPLIATTRTQLFQTVVQADYDFAWSPGHADGEFLTTFSHAIRPPGLQGISSSRIRYSSNEDVRVTMTSELGYSHTPGNLSRIGLYATIYDSQSSNVITNGQDLGGEGYQRPSNGTLSLFIDTVIPAGTPFEIRYSLNTTTNAVLPGSGVADANGQFRISIKAIPEPETALLLLFATSALVIRRGPPIASLAFRSRSWLEPYSRFTRR